MKIKILCAIAAAALVVGCAETRQEMGGAADNDNNVLTGGPITGTTLQDLPQAVRDTLKKRAPSAEVADIDKTTRDGQTAYEISFTEPGKNPKICVSETGQVLAGSEKPAKTSY